MDDPEFFSLTMEKIRTLTRGCEAVDRDNSDWEFELKTQLVCYTNTRLTMKSDPSQTHSTTQTSQWKLSGRISSAWCCHGVDGRLDGFDHILLSVTTEHILLGTDIAGYCILAPCGQFPAKVLPYWGFTIFGRRVSLNPGPWSFKEQVFATIVFSISNGAGGTYYTCLGQVSQSSRG